MEERLDQVIPLSSGDCKFNQQYEKSFIYVTALTTEKEKLSIDTDR
jgi:hypothetical protein